MGLPLLTIFLAGLATAAAGQAPSRKAVSTAESEVRAAIERWASAVRTRDAAALDKIFAADLFITDYNGVTRGKAAELEVLKPNAASVTTSVVNEDLVVRLYDDARVALATAVVRMTFENAGSISVFAMRYTSVWEKRAGRWQLTVLHTSRLPNK